VPWASATPFTVRAMRAFISRATVASCVRIVPSIVTRSAMMVEAGAALDAADGEDAGLPAVDLARDE